ncbi:MAG TPA: hypothetical protein VGJ13_00905 [Pseudonocardiaceae bacterium]
MTVVLASVGAAFLAVALAGALLVVTYRRVLRPRLLDEILRLSGPAIIHALLPQQVMTTLLSKIYGDSEANRDVVAGLLGGEGVEPDGSDLAISTHTTVDMELRAVDQETYELTLTCTYSFKANVASHRFVIFATCDPLLRDSIVLACRIPLFESWFVPDPALFAQSVDEMLSSVQIGIRYTDLDGRNYGAEPSKTALKEVEYREWPEFLRFFRESLGTMPRQNPANYMGTLRIFECDLGELAHVDHAVGAVEQLSLRFRALLPVDEGFCYWQAPYPCYVERVTFDVAGLVVDGERSWLFRMIPFTLRSSIESNRWTQAEQLSDLFVCSWLLPGHGVALLWKPGTDDHTSTYRGPEV